MTFFPLSPYQAEPHNENVGSPIDGLLRRLRRKRTFELLRPRLSKGSASFTDRRSQPRVGRREPVTLEWFDPNGACHSERATVCDSSPDGFGIRASEEFLVGQTIWVETDPGAIAKAVVRHCGGEGSAFFAGALRVAQERRRADRNPVCGGATLNWGATKGEKRSSPVLVRNVTEQGLQIESPQPVPVGIIALMQGELLEWVGSTCYCKSQGDRYLVGMHLVRQAYDKATTQYEEG